MSETKRETLLDRIDKICEEFERAWRNSDEPALEPYMSDWIGEGRATLFRHLLELDIDYRKRNSKPVTALAYVERFPDFKNLVFEVLGEVESTRLDPADQRDTKSPLEMTLLSDSTSGQAAAPEREFGRYRIIRKLGQGAMGTVFLAVDSELQREVALKLPRKLDQDGSVERFYREARSAANLRHRNICPVFDIGEQNGLRYISMAYVNGMTLGERIQQQLPAISWAVRTVKTIASALAAAHRCGIVHRDLKPANIMIDDQDEPVVMDFGLARNQSAQDAITQDGVIVGTPSYMAPEQIEAYGQVEPITDVYSLGVMFYELLTGQRPFIGDIASVLGQIMHQDPEPPRKLRSDLPEQLEAICLKMMARDPADRYQSMEQVVAELDGFEAKPPTPNVVVPETVEDSQRLALPVMRIIFAATVALLGFGLWLWSPWDTVARVQRMDVVHFVRLDEQTLQREGIVGSDSFGARFGDLVRLDIELSEQAYCYLIALNPAEEPENRIQLCYPSDAGTAPERLQFLKYPVKPTSYFGLTDGVGQQAFVLCVSEQPLPPFQSLTELLRGAPWTVSAEQGVWAYRSGEQTFQLVQSRERGTEVQVVASDFDSLARHLDKHLPVDSIHAIAFPVDPSL